mmetsp:Transcript_21220/g.28231  ORF Transcript_21220/g.28231 Transcript_21220/m.28231 type:complete len:212 (-) Transcript_21220:127-762(-)
MLTAFAFFSASRCLASAASAFCFSIFWRLASRASADALFFASAAAFFSSAASDAALFLASAAVFFASVAFWTDVTGCFVFGPAEVAAPPPNNPKSPAAGLAFSLLCSSKKYLDPDVVCTTAPPTPSPVIGDVVIASPLWKAEEPVINPDMEPSRFCLHFDIVGTPLGATDLGEGFGAGTEGDVSAVFCGPPKPNRDTDGAAGFAFSIAFGA